MSTYGKRVAMAIVFLACGGTAAADPPPVPAAPAHDAALARALGADELGMRHYVRVVLKTGPHTMPAGPERDAMFKGHFANMSRLAAEGKLAVAGPLDGVDGWRGLFILATADLAEARRLVETDPVVAHGEMVAEYHALYSSAALMQVNETHGRIAAKKRP